MTTRRTTAIVRALPLALGAAAIALTAADQPPAADAPLRTVTDFVAPIFDLRAGGVKVGEMRGATATYRSEEIADFGQFVCRTFAPDRSELYRAEADSAMVYMKQRVAVGEGALHVVAPGFDLTGRDWKCSINAQHVTINENVRVEFDAQIGDILQ